MKLEELQVYQLSMKLGEEVWNVVNKWDFNSLIIESTPKT